MTRSIPRCLTVAALAASLVVLSACESRPKSGRIDLDEQIKDETKASEIQPTALIEFSDEFPKALIRDLHDVPLIRDTPAAVTVIMGDLNNQTRKVNTADFEMMVARIRSNLLNSKIAEEDLRFVEKRARMTRLADREKIVSDDVPDGPEAYDPKTTYAMNGDFYRVTRGDTNLYYMEVQLVNFATNTIVFSQKYDVKQVRTD